MRLQRHVQALHSAVSYDIAVSCSQTVLIWRLVLLTVPCPSNLRLVQILLQAHGPGNAVEGAAAVFAHEAHECQLSAGVSRRVPDQALGTSQASAEQPNQAGISTVRVG